jgi:hypothetical protein
LPGPSRNDRHQIPLSALWAAGTHTNRDRLVRILFSPTITAAAAPAVLDMWCPGTQTR